MVKKLWLILSLAVFLLACQANFIPVTGIEIGYYGIQSSPENSSQISSPKPEVESDLQPLHILGISSPGTFSYTIVNQPQGNAGFVSYDPDSLTKFQLAEKYGSIGLLAHNYLAGHQFFLIDIGDRLVLEMNNGSSRDYHVISIKKYQALNPYSPYSEFIDLSNNERITASKLFMDTYGSGNKLILQTCIEQNGVDAWGRLFVIAESLPNISNRHTEDLSAMLKYGVVY